MSPIFEGLSCIASSDVAGYNAAQDDGRLMEHFAGFILRGAVLPLSNIITGV